LHGEFAGSPIGVYLQPRLRDQELILSYRFDLDTTNQILRCRFEGRVTDETITEFYQDVANHMTRTNPRAGIADFTAVTSFEVSSNTIRTLAASPPAMPDEAIPRFIIAPTPHMFGMFRMFQTLGEKTRPLLQVVHTQDEVYLSLGVQPAPFAPVDPG
jgi:hypothetical protein